MKKKIFILTFVGCMLLSGCSKVSQEEYDSLKTKYDNLVENNNDLSDQYDKVKANYEQLLEEKSQHVEAELKTAVPRAYAETYFGEGSLTLCSENGEYVQIICEKKYEASVESIQEIYKSILSSIPGLVEYYDKIEWERIGIKFLQENGKELIEYVLKKENGQFDLECISMEYDNLYLIITALSNIS